MGVYTITLTTPEGTVAEINDTVASQSVVATDEDNVFTILVNAENRGSLSAVFGAFRLVEVDETDPDPEEDDNNDTESPEDKDDTKSPDKKEDVDSEELPKMGMVTTPIGIGLASILTGLGLVVIGKKKKDEK